MHACMHTRFLVCTGNVVPGTSQNPVPGRVTSVEANPVNLPVRAVALSRSLAGPAGLCAPPDRGCLGDEPTRRLLLTGKADLSWTGLGGCQSNSKSAEAYARFVFVTRSSFIVCFLDVSATLQPAALGVQWCGSPVVICVLYL